MTVNTNPNKSLPVAQLSVMLMMLCGCQQAVHPKAVPTFDDSEKSLIFTESKFPVVTAEWVKTNACHRVYRSEARDKFGGYTLYRCKNLQTDVEVDDGGSK
jgi:hypothetical protein